MKEILKYPTVFDALEAEFASSPVFFDIVVEQGECGDGLPVDAVQMCHARDIISGPDASPLLCDAIWGNLAQRVRICPNRWQLAVIWLMLPRLRAITHRLRRIWRTDAQDIQSDVIVGFIEALRQVDPSRQNIGGFLWWAVYRYARRACEQSTREIPNDDVDRMAVQASTALAEPINRGRATLLPVRTPLAPTQVQGERLGSIAMRLGLRDRLHGQAERRPVNVNWEDDAA